MTRLKALSAACLLACIAGQQVFYPFPMGKKFTSTSPLAWGTIRDGASTTGPNALTSCLTSHNGAQEEEQQTCTKYTKAPVQSEYPPLAESARAEWDGENTLPDIELIVVRHAFSCANQGKRYDRSKRFAYYLDPSISNIGVSDSITASYDLTKYIKSKWSAQNADALPEFGVLASTMIRAQQTAYYMLAGPLKKPISVVPGVGEKSPKWKKVLSFTGVMNDNTPYPRDEQIAKHMAVNPYVRHSIAFGADYRVAPKTQDVNMVSGMDAEGSLFKAYPFTAAIANVIKAPVKTGLLSKAKSYTDILDGNFVANDASQYQDRYLVLGIETPDSLPDSDVFKAEVSGDTTYLGYSAGREGPRFAIKISWKEDDCGAKCSTDTEKKAWQQRHRQKMSPKQTSYVRCPPSRKLADTNALQLSPGDVVEPVFTRPCGQKCVSRANEAWHMMELTDDPKDIFKETPANLAKAFWLRFALKGGKNEDNFLGRIDVLCNLALSSSSEVGSAKTEVSGSTKDTISDVEVFYRYLARNWPTLTAPAAPGSSTRRAVLFSHSNFITKAFFANKPETSNNGALFIKLTQAPDPRGSIAPGQRARAPLSQSMITYQLDRSRQDDAAPPRPGQTDDLWRPMVHRFGLPDYGGEIAATRDLASACAYGNGVCEAAAGSVACKCIAAGGKRNCDAGLVTNWDTAYYTKNFGPDKLAVARAELLAAVVQKPLSRWTGEVSSTGTAVVKPVEPVPSFPLENPLENQGHRFRDESDTLLRAN